MRRMTVTPRISASGIRLVSGGSASKMNLFTPTGIGPTSRESSSWSCSSLLTLIKGSLVLALVVNLRGGRSNVGELPFKVLRMVS